MGIIGKTVEVVKFPVYLAEGERVSDEEHGHHDKALRYTCRDWGAVDFSDVWWINCMWPVRYE